MFLSRNLKISFSESNEMSYTEFQTALKLGMEYLKEIGPDIEDT